MSCSPAVTRSIRLPARVDTILRQLSMETGRTRSDLLKGILADALDRRTADCGTGETGDGQAYACAEHVIRPVVIPEELNVRLVRAADATGLGIGRIVSDLATQGVLRAVSSKEPIPA